MSMNTSSNKFSKNEMKMENPETKISLLRKKYQMLNTPMDDILDYLKKSIIGQNSSIKDILLVIYNNQFLNMLEELTNGEINIKRMQAIAVGPSGVGKTKTISKIAELFEIPYVKFNATQLTATGFVGQDLDSILLALIEAANGTVEAAQRGIIFLDEIDKKVSSTPNNTSGRDYSGTDVQQELLKLLEPSIIYVGSKQIPFDTHSLTVIAGGYFNGLSEIREKRLFGSQKMGFSPNSIPTKQHSDSSSPYLPSDFIQLGFIPEFIGRFSMITEFKHLTFENYIDIIYSPDSILQQYLQIFQIKDVELYIDPIHFSKIAEECLESKTGARDLERKVLELLKPFLYEVEQHFSTGICELDYEGNYNWLFEN